MSEEEEDPEFVPGRKALTVKNGISSSAVEAWLMIGQDEELLTCEVLASNALFRSGALDAVCHAAPRINLKPKEVQVGNGPVVIFGAGQVLNTVGFLGIAHEAEPFKPSGLEANQLPQLPKGGTGRTTGGAYEIFRPGQAPSSLFAERRYQAEGNDPVLLVRDSFKRYLEAALLHLTDLQRRWPSEGTSQRWQVEELTSLCKECGLASAKAVVACERVLKSRWNAQVQLEAEEPATGVPMPGFAKLQPRVPSKGEKRVKSTQSPHLQRWRALKKGAKPLAIQDVVGRSPALMQPCPDEQMERRRLLAVVRLQRAVRRYFRRLRLQQRQAAAEASHAKKRQV
eukprot:s146_g24.t1